MRHGASLSSSGNPLWIVPTQYTRSIEQVAQAVVRRDNNNNNNESTTTTTTPSAALLWYQAYILKDRVKTERLLRRAVKAGYQGIFLTVDSIRFGYREADARNGFDALPAPHRLVNYDDELLMQAIDNNHSGDNDNNNNRNDDASKVYNARQEKAWDQNSQQLFDENVSWSDLRWIKSVIGDEIPL